MRGKRKIYAALLILAIAVLLDVFTKTGLSSNLKEILLGVFSVFVVGNGVEYAAETVKSKYELENPQQDQAVEPKNDMDTELILDKLQKNQEEITQHLTINTQAITELIKRSIR